MGIFREEVDRLQAGGDFVLGPDILWECLYHSGHSAERHFRWANREANAGRVWEVRGADLVELPPEEAAEVNEQAAEDTSRPSENR